MSLNYLRRILPGKKTHIANVIRAGAGLAVMFGFAVDPDAAAQFVKDSIDWLIAGEVLLATAVSLFRQAGKPKEE